MFGYVKHFCGWIIGTLILKMFFSWIFTIIIIIIIVIIIIIIIIVIIIILKMLWWLRR